jgi:hypothetical protein
MAATKAVFQDRKRHQKVLQRIPESFMQMGDFEVMGAAIDYGNAGVWHMAQEGNQCGDSRVTAANNYNLKLLMPGYIEWQKGHNSSFANTGSVLVIPAFPISNFNMADSLARGTLNKSLGLPILM